MSKSLQAIRGMNDILPDQSPLWRYFEGTVAGLLDTYGYSQIRTPIVEFTELFKRSIGEVTDIVEKEMYTFEDRNGDSLTLRPEGTAACVRAVLEHGITGNGQVQKLWYVGQMFRHERPQKGRYRQFHQIGVEVFNLEGPDVDAELIMLTWRLWGLLGIQDAVKLELNSLGTSEARARYREALRLGPAQRIEYAVQAAAQARSQGPDHVFQARVVDRAQARQVAQVVAEQGRRSAAAVDAEGGHVDVREGPADAVGIHQRQAAQGRGGQRQHGIGAADLGADQRVYRPRVERLGLLQQVLQGGLAEQVFDQHGGRAYPGDADHEGLVGELGQRQQARLQATLQLATQEQLADMGVAPAAGAQQHGAARQVLAGNGIEARHARVLFGRGQWVAARARSPTVRTCTRVAPARRCVMGSSFSSTTPTLAGSAPA